MNDQGSKSKNILFLKISGACSIIQSFLYIIAVAALSQTPLLDLLGQSRIQGMELFMRSYPANPWPLMIMCLAFIFMGLLGFIAVAPATELFLKEQENGWLTLGKHLGMLCLAVITVYYTWFIVTMPEKAALYSISDSATKSLIAKIYDPQEPSSWISWFMFAGMGLWVAAVGSAAYRNKTLSKGFTLICAVKTGGFWLAHAGIIFQQAPLAIIGAVAGGLIGGPAYHVWLGIAMRRSQ
ncbi:MAG: hypothetical protein HF978_02830 [Desulfobacteraceae bacterium]|nr:hypothetical protein [Desulfobacteraceae bacterium]MBC2754459.1 hypothetical protein [Desulfobacteraceae bacterium]